MRTKHTFRLPPDLDLRAVEQVGDLLIVFGAGTVQYTWGLDNFHSNPTSRGAAPSPRATPRARQVLPAPRSPTRYTTSPGDRSTVGCADRARSTACATCTAAARSGRASSRRSSWR